MSYRFVDRFRAEPGWSCSKAVYKPVWHIPLLSVQWINSWWWTEKLSEKCRVSCQNKFVKLVHLVGFIIKKTVTTHGHTNVEKYTEKTQLYFLWIHIIKNLSLPRYKVTKYQNKCQLQLFLSSCHKEPAWLIACQKLFSVNISLAEPGGRAVRGLVSATARLLRLWIRNPRGHGRLSPTSAVCC